MESKKEKEDKDVMEQARTMAFQECVQSGFLKGVKELSKMSVEDNLVVHEYLVLKSLKYNHRAAVVCASALLLISTAAGYDVDALQKIFVGRGLITVGAGGQWVPKNEF